MKKYFGLISLFLVIGSCTKHYKPPIILDSEVKAKYYFKRGSYWIYRDSISGRMDSFYMQSSHDIIPRSQYNGQEQEFLEMSIIQNTGNPADSINWLIYVYADGRFYADYYKKMESGEVIRRTFVLQYLSTPRIYAVPTDYVNNDCSVKILPIYTTGSQTFHDVMEIDYWCRTNDNNNSAYYINDSVGYIKMRLNYDDGTNRINEVWELQRWHLLK